MTREIKAQMKLLKKQVSEKDGAGSVILRAEEPEDMWQVYNLIHVNDSVKTTTIRKVRWLHKGRGCVAQRNHLLYATIAGDQGGRDRIDQQPARAPDADDRGGANQL